MPTEIELKYNIPDKETFAELENLTGLEGFVIEKTGTKTIVDQYLDTADQRLLQAGFACRLRTPQQGGAQLIATLKSLTPAQNGLHRRQEIEQPVPTAESAGWPDGELKTVLTGIVKEASLQPLFTIYQTRHKYHVLAGQVAQIELSLDMVGGEAGQTDYFELELELLEDGTESVLQEVSTAIQARWSLRPEQRSKFERAYVAAFGRKNSMFNVTAHERFVLEQIAAGAGQPLARRANIILFSEEGYTPAEIATQVELTPRTVKHWQRGFAEKRLSIFPNEDILAVLQDTEPNADVTAGAPATETEAAPETAVAEPKPETKTGTETKPKPKAKSKSKVKAKKKSKTKSPTPVNKPGKEKKAQKKKPKKKARAGKGKNALQPTRRIGLQATDSFAEAGRKVLKFHFARMLAHEAGTRLGEDIEELHDMRVATRRMRAAFNLFGAGYQPKAIKPLLQGLKATGRALGPVRDLDVFMEKLQAYRESLDSSEQDDFVIFLNVWAKKRDTARKQMLKYLDSKTYKRFKRDFQKFVTSAGSGEKAIPKKMPPVPSQLRHITPGLVYKAYGQVRAYETLLNNAPIETLHQLRISFKGLRYTLEFLQEVLGEGRGEVLGEVKRMQNHLGDLNDADVAAALLRNFLAEWEDYQQHLPLTRRQRPTPIVSYLNVQINKRHHLLVTFPEAWETFNRPGVREKLAQAISIL
jgi:CHAD domain-containing protein